MWQLQGDSGCGSCRVTWMWQLQGDLDVAAAGQRGSCRVTILQGNLHVISNLGEGRQRRSTYPRALPAPYTAGTSAENYAGVILGPIHVLGAP